MESSDPDCIPSIAAAFRSFAAVSAQLIAAGAWTDVIPDVLATLGQVVGADRACLFENYRTADGRLLAKVVAEWCSPGVETAFTGGPGREVAYGHSVLPFGEELASRGDAW